MKIYNCIISKCMKIVIIYGMLIFGGLSHAATITCANDSRLVVLKGEITEGDHRNITSCKGPFTLAISSEGGLVSEAMKIGRYVRDKKMIVMIPDNGKCLSSCVYILAAGVSKNPDGTVGIHRPYFISPPNHSYDAALKNVLSKSKEYFREMNIPESLAEDMFSIPPSEVKELDKSLLKKYRLNQDDMAWAEENSMREAARNGISRQEYESRYSAYEKYADECARSKSTNPSVAIIVECMNIASKKFGLH